MGEYNELVEKEASTEQVVKLATEIVPFFLKHNAEADACDLLLELERISLLTTLVDKDTFERVCLYIIRYYFSLINVVAASHMLLLQMMLLY
jgi:26S proteasome regulatory subunit N1